MIDWRKLCAGVAGRANRRRGRGCVSLAVGASTGSMLMSKE